MRRVGIGLATRTDGLIQGRRIRCCRSNENMTAIPTRATRELESDRPVRRLDSKGSGMVVACGRRTRDQGAPTERLGNYHRRASSNRGLLGAERSDEMLPSSEPTPLGNDPARRRAIMCRAIGFKTARDNP